ncbi:MAG: hypothetical protein SFX19_10080 [Alphaproteobacteria bacterium]|nr:hypothetical protein [Alphaproteobacteria bacterium]
MKKDKQRGSRFVDPDFDTMSQVITGLENTVRSANPDLHLWRSVIFQALEDLSHSYPGRHRNQTPYREAVTWFFSSDQKVRSDFARICELAGIESTALIRRAARVMHKGQQLRAAHGTAKNYHQRRASRNPNSRFSVAGPGMSSRGQEFTL